MYNFPRSTPWRTMLPAWLVAVMILIVGAVACGGSDDSTEAEVAWAELLTHVPDTEGNRQWAVIHDFARARNDLGLEVPAQDAPDEEVFNPYVLEMMGGDGPLWVYLQNGFASHVLINPHFEIRSEVGFSVLEVDDWVAGGREADEFTILRGRFDADAIDEAVHNDPGYSDLLEEESHEGVSYYTWPSGSDPEARPNTEIHPLDQHSLAVNGDAMYWSLSAQAVRQMIAAGTGNAPSLADREDHRLLAEELDRLGVWAAFLSTDLESQSGDPMRICRFECTDEMLDEIQEDFLDKEPRLAPFRAFASGTGIDDRGRFTAVVLVHEDADAAKENVERLQERIEKGRSFVEGTDGRTWEQVLFPQGEPPQDYLEVSSGGRVLTAKIFSDGASFWYRWYITSDPFLLMEE